MKGTPPALGAQGWPTGGSWAVWRWHMCQNRQQAHAGSRAAGQSSFRLCPERSKQKTLATLGCPGAAEALQNQLLSPARNPHLELPCSSPRRNGWVMPHGAPSYRWTLLWAPWTLEDQCSPVSPNLLHWNRKPKKIVPIELSMSEAESQILKQDYYKQKSAGDIIKAARDEGLRCFIRWPFVLYWSFCR